MTTYIHLTYNTRKSIVPIMTNTILCPEDSLSKYNFTSVFFDNNVRFNRYDNSNDLYLDYILNSEGYYRYYGSNDCYPFYYIRDHIGNICQTWIYLAQNYKMCVQRMQYYPSGLPWNQQSGAVEHPYRYNGKEFVEQFGLDEYDSKARWYYPAIARTTTMDPLCEKYYDTSPYAWCGSNTVNRIDPNGRWIKTAWDVFNIGLDIQNFSENIQNGNTVDAIVDAAGLVLDVGATLLPIVPGGAGTALKAYRTADKIHDVSTAANSGQKAKNIGNYIKPNGGNAKPHGGAKHNSAIDKYIEDLPKESTNVRKIKFK